jgi:hypothetical protein
MDIRGERHDAVLREMTLNRVGEAYPAAGTLQNGNDFRFEAVRQPETFPRHQPLPTHQRFPGALVFAAQEQDFHLAAGLFPRRKPRRDDARLVQHQQIAGMQVFADLTENAVFQLPVFAVQDQQPR